MHPISHHNPDELLAASLIARGQAVLADHLAELDADTDTTNLIREGLASGALHLRTQATLRGQAAVNLIRADELPLGDGIPIGTATLAPGEMETLALGLGKLLAEAPDGSELWARQQRGDLLLGAQTETVSGDAFDVHALLALIVFR